MNGSELYNVIIIAIIAFALLFSITLVCSIYLMVGYKKLFKAKIMPEEHTQPSQPTMILGGSDCTFTMKELKKTKIIELVFTGLEMDQKPILISQQGNKIVYEVSADVDANLDIGERLELVLKK